MNVNPVIWGVIHVWMALHRDAPAVQKGSSTLIILATLDVPLTCMQTKSRELVSYVSHPA